MAGRPRKYETAEALEQAIEDYFNPVVSTKINTKCGPEELPAITERELNPNPTITGLALHLGFESRQSFYDYEKEGEFSYAIKRARLTIESKYEEKLYGQACTGAIFALKNFGWHDKTQQDITLTTEAPQPISLDGKEWKPK